MCCVGLPGRRLFQYRDEDGVRIVTASDVNAFLREIAGVKISLKDFRTLCASAAALEALAHVAPATSERGRRRQVKQAVTAVSEELANTPTICRKSYVHQTVVAAFENGKLAKFSEMLKRPPLAGASRAIAGAGRRHHGGVARSSCVMPAKAGVRRMAKRLGVARFRGRRAGASA